MSPRPDDGSERPPPPGSRPAPLPASPYGDVAPPPAAPSAEALGGDPAAASPRPAPSRPPLPPLPARPGPEPLSTRPDLRVVAGAPERPARRFTPGPDDTQVVPTLPPVPAPEWRRDRDTGEQVRVDDAARRRAAGEAAAREERDRERSRRDASQGPSGGSRGIMRAAGTMAVATAVSRVTGFLRTAVLTAVLGLGLVGDAYTTANTLPNIVYELLLGGVLSSVIVPLLVSAQEKHRDKGVRYTQQLFTLMTVGLVLLTVVAVLAAPALTWLMNIRGDPDQVELANWLARILLVEIVFYGIGAMATAVLNSRGVFGAPAWAPVLNNVVVIITGFVFVAASGAGPLTVTTITDTQVWLLGIGTTLGIAVQALVLVPLISRAGIPLRPRWALRGTGLGEAGTLGLWVVGYVLVSQVGVVVATQIANQAADDGGLGTFALANASLLFQMPYGIIGVALLTALLPRMSRAAARGDVPGVISDLTLGTRLSALGLLPITALLVVLGPAAATVAFGRGETGLSEARDVGVALAVGAFGLLPMAVTLLQLRVFYAMKDARTPTVIQVVMVAVRVPLMLLVPVVVEPRHVVAGLMLATSTTYVAGWVAGAVALRRRLGTLGTGGAVDTLLRMLAVSVVAGLLSWLTVSLVGQVVGNTVAGSLVTLAVGTVVTGVTVLVGAVVARVPEARRVLEVLRRRRPGGRAPRDPGGGGATSPGRPSSAGRTGGRQRP